MEISLGKSSKALVILTLVLILSMMIFSTYKHLVKSDFYLYAHVGCNAQTEDCFVKECDMEEDLRCPYNGEVYYKILYTRASEAPLCVFDGENNCPELECADDGDCEFVYCSEENLELYELDGYCSSFLNG